MKDVIKNIREDIERLQRHKNFVEWLTKEQPAPRYYVLINDSFVFRDAQTKKSGKHLALPVDAGGKMALEPFVVQGIRMNADFKRITPRDKNSPVAVDLETSVRTELICL